MTEPFHDLHGFFAFLSAYHREEEVVRPFPYMAPLIDQARDALGRAEHRPLHTAMSGQVFHMTVELAGGSTYKLAWNIDHAEELARKAGIRPVLRSTLKLAQNMRPGVVNPDHLPNVAGNTAPILVAECPMFMPADVVIDGNHRTISRMQQGMPLVEALVLPPGLHLQAMAGDLFRTLYTIHHNFTQVTRYMVGYLDSPAFLPYP